MLKTFSTLQKVGDPIAERRKEAVERPKVLEELGRCLVHYRKALTIYQDGVSYMPLLIFLIFFYISSNEIKDASYM